MPNGKIYAHIGNNDHRVLPGPTPLSHPPIWQTFLVKQSLWVRLTQSIQAIVPMTRLIHSILSTASARAIPAA